MSRDSMVMEREARARQKLKDETEQMEKSMKEKLAQFLQSKDTKNMVARDAYRAKQAGGDSQQSRYRDGGYDPDGGPVMAEEAKWNRD